MNKSFSIAVAIAAAVSVLLSGCSSDNSPNELDILIEHLQTTQFTSETVPEETAEEEPENTEGSVTAEATEETTGETADPENTETASEDTAAPESTEETTEATETEDTEAADTQDVPVTYKSLTVTVISVEEDHIMVELDGVVYKTIIDESTIIFGGEILKDKTVTITYVLNDDDSEASIAAAAITVLP